MRAQALAFTLWTAAAAAFAADAPVTLLAPGMAPRTVTAADLAALPQHRQSATFQTGHGAQQTNYGGALLWDAVRPSLPPGAPKTHVRYTVLVIGADGYVAAVAEGEIDPAFEGKSILLAHPLDAAGQPTAALRLVVPGDRHGARYVENVVRLEVH